MTTEITSDTRHRVTKRVVAVDSDLTIQNWLGGFTFRVVRIVETLEQSPRGDAYDVELTGPRQTKAGKDHAASDGKQAFGDGALAGPLDTLPEEIRPLLIGPDGLRAGAKFMPGTARPIMQD